MTRVSRRFFVTSMGAASLAPGGALLSRVAPAEAKGPPSAAEANPDKPAYAFFSTEEASFIEAACERLIPADDAGTGALNAGVPNYLEKQLGGSWGAGERLYRSGPWLPGTPSQGYQLPFTPAELFHVSLRAINRSLKALGTPFHEMPVERQDDYLKALEARAHETATYCTKSTRTPRRVTEASGAIRLIRCEFYPRSLTRMP